MNQDTIPIEDLELKSAQELLKWALEKYGDKIALASSFGTEDVVLIDMLVKINPTARIFTIDTGRLPQETYEVMDRIKEKYKIRLEVYYPDTESVEEMVSRHGFNLFYRSVELRRLCCKVRKVESLNRALKNLDAWICGLRREQSLTRTEIKKIEIDQVHNSIIKINPLVDWTEKQVWDYIKENDVPYNSLHDKGYPSIGCAPCTRTIKPGEDIRAGRWWWEPPEKKECGLHCKK
ncbi:MAG: phosphoadenylyl-sulfate reductase [Candidatus Aminicenantes bacterium]|nr:MAG: phosphoadenylyl-sulfate reductase [Candidatus Aminicenantes bacterium]